MQMKAVRSPRGCERHQALSGWLNRQLSKSRLTVVPGYSHYNFITSAEVPQIVGKFLADPLTNQAAGAQAASQSAATPGNKQ